MNENITKLKKAVAMKYDPLSNAAPVIVAKGQGELADKILEKAKESDVPIQEDSSLVEVLSKLDINSEIPPELFAIVAEILSSVYRADNKAKDWEWE